MWFVTSVEIRAIYISTTGPHCSNCEKNPMDIGKIFNTLCLLKKLSITKCIINEVSKLADT